MNDWKREAARLYFDEHRTWGEIIAKLQHNFPGKHADQIRDAIRHEAGIAVAACTKCGRMAGPFDIAEVGAEVQI